MPLLTLLTDFGDTDYYVAAVKGTVLTAAPGTALVDISHRVPPGQIATGAFLLGAAAPTFPSGTGHLAVVDPGVGSDRRILAVMTPQAFFVGPDNGVLEPALADPDARVYAVDRPDLYRHAPGSTFHGRDRFAPVAAALLRGEAADALGPVIDDPIRLQGRPPRRGEGELKGQVIHIDRFGNLISNIPSAWLEGGVFQEGEIDTPHGQRTLRRRVDHYAELSSGEVGILPGSLATEELSLPGESLAARWQVTIGARMRIVLR